MDQENNSPRPKKGKSKIIPLLMVTLIVATGFAMLYFVVQQLQSGPEEEQRKQEEARKEEQQKKEEQEKEKPKIKVYKVSKEHFVHTMATLGTVEAKSKVELRFEVNGVIEELLVKEGDQVRQSDVIAEISHNDAELKIDFRKSKLKEAQIEEKNWNVKVKQNKELLDAGAITQSKYDESKFALERAQQASKSAKIELLSAEAELEKTYLRTPIDGIVGQVKSHKGEFVSSQTKVLTVMEIAEVHVEFSVLEKDIQDVKEEMDIFLTVDTYPGEKFKGSIIALGASVETTEGRARKVKALVKNEGSKLIPGMFAHVEVVLMQREDAITVPNSAFANIEQDTSSVWVIEEKDKVVRREVSVEHFSLEKALIESGLKVGDLVVVDVAALKLKEGQEVEIVEVREAAKK